MRPLIVRRAGGDFLHLIMVEVLIAAGRAADVAVEDGVVHRHRAVVPVDNTISPLTPSDTAFAVASVMSPVDDDALSPDRMLTDPPDATVRSPGPELMVSQCPDGVDAELDLAPVPDAPVAARLIEAMEMAFRMQFSVPDVFDVTRESQATRDLYGDSLFGRRCLMARKLVETGVPFVEVDLGGDDDLGVDTADSDKEDDN